MNTKEMLIMLQSRESLSNLVFTREGGIIKIRNGVGNKHATVTPIRDQWDGFIFQLDRNGKVMFDEGLVGTPTTIRILLEVFFE